MIIMCQSLKVIRKESNLTQEDVARMLGLTRQAYSHKEKGIRKFSIEEALALSDIFNTDVRNIFLNKKATERS